MSHTSIDDPTTTIFDRGQALDLIWDRFGGSCEVSVERGSLHLRTRGYFDRSMAEGLMFHQVYSWVILRRMLRRLGLIERGGCGILKRRSHHQLSLRSIPTNQPQITNDLAGQA